MLTLERAVELAQQIVSENPDFVYNRAEDDSKYCFYVPLPVVREWLAEDDPVFKEKLLRFMDTGMIDMLAGESDPDRPREQTGCIVGRILDLTDETRHRGREMHSTGVEDMSETYPDMFADKKTVQFLNVLQDSQDTGSTWGESLETAIRRIEGTSIDDASDEPADADEY